MLKVLAVLKTAYPYFYRDATPQSASDTLDLWASLFVDDDPALVGIAVKSFIASDERGYPPVPGQIKSLMRLLTSAQPENELEAWSMVRRAIGNPEKRFKQLPPLVRETVGSAAQLNAWGNLAPETVDVTIANSFMRSYREKVQRSQEIAALPPEAKALLEETTQRASIGQTPAKEAAHIEGGGRP